MTIENVKKIVPSRYRTRLLEHMLQHKFCSRKGYSKNEFYQIDKVFFCWLFFFSFFVLEKSIELETNKELIMHIPSNGFNYIDCLFNFIYLFIHVYLYLSK